MNIQVKLMVVEGNLRAILQELDNDGTVRQYRDVLEVEGVDGRGLGTLRRHMLKRNPEVTAEMWLKAKDEFNSVPR
jgi:hypothetical protein